MTDYGTHRTGLTSPTGKIGFAGRVFAEMNTSLYWAGLLKGVCDGVAAANEQILIFEDPTEAAWDCIDGMILCDNVVNTSAYLRTMPIEMPCVSILLPIQNRSSIIFDDYLGGQIMAQYLASLGHRKIIYLIEMNNPVNATGIEQRYMGFRKALRDLNIPLDPSLVLDLKTVIADGESRHDYYEKGKIAAHKWFSKNWRRHHPTALVAQNDPSAMGVIDALHSLGIQVPCDISVLGYDGIEIYDVNQVLSTVETPVFEMGMTAVDMVMKQITAVREGRKPPIEVLKLPVKLIAGATIGKPKLFNVNV